jgi:membrane protease YdiL (CAAX protease family)
MKRNRHRILLAAFIVEGGMLLAAFLLAKYFHISLSLSTDNLLRDILAGTFGAIPPFLLVLFILSERARSLSLCRSLRHTLMVELKMFLSGITVSDMLLISLLAGLGEELLFRGVLQVKLGIIAASIVFGLAHFISPAYVLVTMIMGCYIGSFYLISGSLLVPVTIHSVYDLAALLYLRYWAHMKHQ